MTQILAVGAELIALAGNLLQLLGEIRLIGVLRRLCGELIDLRGKAFNLVLQLFILSGKRLIVRLGFLELRLCSLCGLIRLGDLRRRCSPAPCAAAALSDWFSCCRDCTCAVKSEIFVFSAETSGPSACVD